MMLDTQPLPIFVYGTLKRGQCREKYWPCAPLSVEAAFTRGRLHDLGPYPAMVPGNDLIRGELWHVRAQDMPKALDTLDTIEGCVDGTGDQYVRVVIECRDETGRNQRAYAYHFAQPERIEQFPAIVAGPEGFCEWPAPAQSAAQKATKPPRTSLADWAEQNAEDWGATLNSTDVEGFTGRKF